MISWVDLNTWSSLLSLRWSGGVAMWMNFVLFYHWARSLMPFTAALMGLGLTGYLKPLIERGENESILELTWMRSGEVMPSSMANRSWYVWIEVLFFCLVRSSLLSISFEGIDCLKLLILGTKFKFIFWEKYLLSRWIWLRAPPWVFTFLLKLMLSYFGLFLRSICLLSMDAPEVSKLKSSTLFFGLTAF